MTLSPSPNENKKSTNWRGLLIWILLALLIRWLVIEPRWIPSGSMLPTLQVQDRILVEKLRPNFSRNQKKPLPFGSIVVFHPPTSLTNAGYEKETALIKRVIGLPGDTVEVHNGNIFLNGALLTETWRNDLIDYEMSAITVPPHQLWVLGDNRNNSLDSHIWGPLPEKEVIGTAVWRYWPLKRFGPIRFPTQKNI